MNTTNTAAGVLIVEQALRSAFGLGQTYWQQVDSESYRQHAKAGATIKRFEALVAEVTRRLEAASQQAASEPYAFAWFYPDGKPYTLTWAGGDAKRVIGGGIKFESRPLYRTAPQAAPVDPVQPEPMASQAGQGASRASSEWLSTVRAFRGIRVEGDTVVIAVKGGNKAARSLCGGLIVYMRDAAQHEEQV